MVNRQYRIRDETIDRLGKYAAAQNKDGKFNFGLTVDDVLSDLLHEVGF